MTQMILRLQAVRERVALSRSSIYLRVSEGSFPKPIKIGKRASGWLEGEVSEWLENQIAQSRNNENNRTGEKKNAQEFAACHATK